MSIPGALVAPIRTTAKARSVQRCGTDDCIVCGKRTKGVTFNATVVHMGPNQDGTHWARKIERAMWPLCPKHRDFVGTIDRDFGSNHGQFHRVTIK